MASKIFPDMLEEMAPGEERDFFFDFVNELDGDTAGSGIVEVFDADGKDVTQSIAPPSGEFGAWAVSGTTLTVTFRIPGKGFSESYLAIYTLASTTSGEKYKKYLGILVISVAGVF
jgi:hypothetical protein